MNVQIKHGFVIGVLILAGIFWLPIAAQATTLSVGDISIIGFRSDNDYGDQFSFVAWVELEAGTTINFSDNGFNADLTYRNSETPVWHTWTATEAVDAGTVFALSTALKLSTAGDQIFAFNEGNVIFGLNFDNAITRVPGWRTSGETTSNTSYLPPKLDVPGGSLYLYEHDNGQYTGPRTGYTVDEYKSMIIQWPNYSNGRPPDWYLENDGYDLPSLDGTNFTLTPEPATICLLGLGALGLLCRQRNNKLLSKSLGQ